MSGSFEPLSGAPLFRKNEGWWDSHFVAPFVDHLFLDSKSLRFNRKEIQIQSHHLVTGLSRKADAIIFTELTMNQEAEILLLETAQTQAKKHQIQDRCKLARCLKSCVLNLLSQLGDLSLLKNLGLFGIQTIGT